jgi:hypothetical protein
MSCRTSSTTAHVKTRVVRRGTLVSPTKRNIGMCECIRVRGTSVRFLGYLLFSYRSVDLRKI